MAHPDRTRGALAALPLTSLLALAFAAPLLVVALFSVMPERVFTLTQMPDFSAYAKIVSDGYYSALLWSLGMALAATLILLVICWPLAFGMAKVFGRFTTVLTIAVVLSLIV